jgi:putative CocE/NonD family hydrolase
VTTSIRLDRDLELKTRDGTILRADALRPEIQAKVPAIVIRTPYDKNGAYSTALYPGLTLAKAGFAVVAQDVRSRFASEGSSWPPLDLWNVEGPDGYDTIEWVASMPWCDGNVGMAGTSYLAECQYAAASLRPPSLKAIAPAMHTIGADTFWTFMLMLESIVLTYAAGMAIDGLDRRMPTGEANFAHVAVAMEVLRDPPVASKFLPVAQRPLFTLPGVATYEDVLGMIGRTFMHTGGRGEGLFEVPALMTTGWYDSQLGGGSMFRVFRDHGANDLARNATRMIIGAWTHNYQLAFVGEWGLSALGSAEASFVPKAHIDFFSRHLRDDDTVLDLPVVRYFVMGANEWKVADDWPLPSTDYRRMYLASGGKANSLHGDGRLTWDAPSGGSAPDTFTYDPADPTPSVGGRVMYTGGSTLAGPFNQQRIEQREDVLVYTGDAMESPLELVGPVEVHLWASSSAVDTDFVAKLCDVTPDGASMNLADGIVRAQVRDGWETRSLLEPGRPYEFRIDLGATGHVVRPGHRLRVTITSSGFPHWERNMNTGGRPGADAAGVVAHQTVFHDADMPSFIVLPVQHAS